MNQCRPSVVRVALAKRVAARWLEKYAAPEYRLTVYAGSESLWNVPGLLRAFRDGRTRLMTRRGSTPIDSIEDLGIEAAPDRVNIWSRNLKGMQALDQWFSDHGCETTGIWVWEQETLV